MQKNKKKTGKVFLVGAGPGDPGLITVKGAQCIERADVVVYDYLASPALLGHAGSQSELIYVGKKGGDHTLSQDGINELIAEKAEQGLVVARLKGGDPFVFGRGGEEAEVLIRRGIPFEVVPGVTSAIAAPAYAGIPLTHRQYTSNVAFVTGHEDPEKPESVIDWHSLAKGIGTLVFFMGVKNLPKIVKNLLENGKPGSTPAALIRWGTTAKQKTVTGVLDNIVKRAKDSGIKAPAIIIIGEVVRLRETMNWFEKKPLSGKTIVVTRAREQAGTLVKALSELGAQCMEKPTIKVVPPDDFVRLDRAINHLDQYAWLVFTSVNGVKFFFKRLSENGLDARALGHIKTATIGPATSKELSTHGINSDIIPKSYRAESIIAAFEKEDVRNKKILLPRAKEARPILPLELNKMGAVVDEIVAYRTVTDKDPSDSLTARLESGQVDMITFTSSSTVKNFKTLIPSNRFKDLIEGIAVASIGPITTETAQKLGFTVHVTADEYTIPGLCRAITKFYDPD